MPKYFDFDNLLIEVSKKLDTKNLESYYKNYNFDKLKISKPYPSEFEDVNYFLFSNKDGKYAWRPFQLIHPAIYVDLVNKITNTSNWDMIVNRFKKFSDNQNIECHSIPIESKNKLSNKAVSIKNWWDEIEQKSIELGLQYEYIMHTDITDCYGSIYTHSIPWALHDKEFAKNNRGFEHIGNLIDKYIRDMSFGQTNGIPQGSILMDFIAEIILGYVDLLLSEKIFSEGIIEYKILRYRDDYRIFTNNPQEAEKISKLLTEVLISMGIKLNANKTFISNHVIRDSIKPDKLYWNGIYKKVKTFQKKLIQIHQLSEEFPNSGSLSTALIKFYDEIEKKEEIKENIFVLISISIDIALKNPRVYPIVCGILSKLIFFISIEERERVLSIIKKRFERIPNVGHIQIWLQRITLTINKNIEYSEKLCKKIIDNDVELWNNEWLNDELKEIIEKTDIIDRKVISEMEPVIELNEIRLFDY